MTSSDTFAITIHVGPDLRLHYYTQLLDGLTRAPATAGIGFARLRMPDAVDSTEGCALVVARGEFERRVFVSAGDHAHLDPALVEWADVYGKVNVPLGIELPDNVVPLGPMFGTRLWGPVKRYVVAARMARGGMALRQAVNQMHFQGRGRSRISRYVPRKSDPAYVFFVARRWGPKHPEPDPPRERFISAVEALPGIEFEGGLLDGARVPHGEYLEKTARSAVVFNCPAVHDCLGWKLGEFLALGKAIISTPLTRTLPAQLVHGKHVHFIDDDPGAISDAVGLITSDHEYRRRLEVGARQWYESHLMPEALLRQLALDDLLTTV